MNLKFIFNIIALTLLSTCACCFVLAKETKKEQRNIGNWITYIEQKSNKKICYVYSNPVTSMLYQGDRQMPYVNINYLGKKIFTITVSTGYQIAPDYPINIHLENKNTNLDTRYKNYAVTYSSSQDMYLINLFIKTMEDHFYVKSHESKDNLSMDYYSLSGLKEALLYLEKQCS
jgi:hypothetical protein